MPSSTTHPASKEQATVTFESTPNPATMKFILPYIVTEEGFACGNAQEAEKSPLAYKIFGFPWTQSVYVGTDFITVTKQDWVEWEFLASPLAGLIEDHLKNQEPVVVDLTADYSAAEVDESDSDIVKRIKLALQKEIRPVVALDGGDVVFHQFNNGVLSIHMRGSCAGCPSSSATLKEGIEVRMKELFPEVQSVVSAS
ncbi:MAG: NifU family protein [Pseudobdellovibrionaceae bacterium]